MRANQLPRTRWLLAAAMAAGLLLTGCTGAAHGTASQLEQTTITVDAFTAIDTAGLFIAERDGLFARQGLTVKLRLQSLVQPEVDDLAAGRADIISGDYVTYIEDQTAGAPDLHNQKVDLRIIAESSFLQPNVLTVVAPRNGPVTSIASLEGKRIAVLAPRNISLVLVESLLQDHGIPLSRESFPFIPFPEVGTAFAHHEMDASFVPEPFVTSLEEGQGDEMVADMDQGGARDFPIQGMATTASWAQRNPGTLRAFLTAYNEGQLIASSNRTQVEEVVESYLKLPPVVARLIALPAFPEGVDPVRLQRVVSALIRFNVISPAFARFNVTSMIYTG
jgi:NitT/TauT family transport system substrate-binding protein